MLFLIIDTLADKIKRKFRVFYKIHVCNVHFDNIYFESQIIRATNCEKPSKDREELEKKPSKDLVNI